MGRGEIGVELDRPIEQFQRFVDVVACPSVDTGHAAQQVVVGIEPLGRLALGALDFGLFEFRRDRDDHARRDLVLQIENVLEATVEAIRPEMRAGRGIDQLSGDPHAVRRLAHAALQHIADAELAADLLHVDAAALVGEA